MIRNFLIYGFFIFIIVINIILRLTNMKCDRMYKFDYLDSTIFKKYNVSNKSWCSIELESYLMLFFLCYEKIPNISIIMNLFINRVFY